MVSAFNLRIPDELKRRLAQQAKAEGRSLTKEIEHRLKRSLRDDPKG